MARLLVSKKGTTPKTALILGIICIAFCIWWFAAGMGEHRFGDSDFEDFTKNAAPILLAFAGMLLLRNAINCGKTCISVYDDHIEGVGVPKGAMRTQNFHFTNGMNYTIQQGGSQLSINCNGQSYSVSLTAGDAQEVYRCVHGGGMTSGQPSAFTGSAAPKTDPVKQPKTESIKIASCPHCAVKCRIPGGKGRIRITCPNPSCGQKYEFDS